MSRDMTLNMSLRCRSRWAAAMVVAALAASLLTLPSPVSPDTVASARNPRWAIPIQRQGVPNLFRVSDDLYRGAQPTTEGFRELQKLGVKTIVNLRAYHSDTEKLRELSLDYRRIRFTVWHPEREDVMRFLQTVTDPKQTPVFVHCQRGADRTGMVVAIYRLCVQRWSKEDAIEEMTRGGYGFASMWKQLVRYVERLDVERLRQEAGLTAPVSVPALPPEAVPVMTPHPAVVAP